MRSLEGASCAELPAFVVDKYFSASLNTEKFLAKTAMAICARCPVLTECRREALSMAEPPDRGVVAGVSANSIKRARAWRAFEQGIRDTPPPSSRPEWLPRTEATEVVEQGLLEADEGVER